MTDKTTFFATMRHPEMRLLRAALWDLKWEHGVDWETFTKLDIEWFGNPNNQCWMLTTDSHMSVCYYPNDARPDFTVMRLHDADDPLCSCEFCHVERMMAQQQAQEVVS